MTFLIDKILKRHRAVIVVFALLAAVSAALTLTVSVNYDLADYLPEDANSTIAIHEMQQEFAQPVPNINIMLSDVSIQQALSIKAELSEVDGLSNITWLDDLVDMTLPLELVPQSVVESYYKDNCALMSAKVDDDRKMEVINAVYGIIGENGALSGEAVISYAAQSTASGETTRAMMFAVPLILLILLVSTNSWIEPLLFLITIGVSIVLNMGTNAFLGSISNITSSIAPILQLAVSLDYAVFLLRSFSEYRTQTPDVTEAMKLAVKRSFPAVLASALTTFLGFIVLVLMKFRIGPDMGIVLAKGIVFSLVCVMMFLPALAVLLHKAIDKTKHRPFLPKFDGVGRTVVKLRVPALILVILLVIPSWLAQQNNSFLYGMGELPEATRQGADEDRIQEVFGRHTSIVLLVPNGDVAKEQLLCDELEQMDSVMSVTAYATAIGSKVPKEQASKAVLEQFYSKSYSRIIVNVDTYIEGDEAFATVEDVRAAAEGYYGDNVFACGQSANLYDVMRVVNDDSPVVNWMAILAIGLVLLLTFKSITLPIILVLTIEAAIWINLAVPYFTSSPICYIGFLVINTVQLGATVDYAILFTDHYKLNRRTLLPKDAVVETVSQTMASILVSGLTIFFAALMIGVVSSNDVVSQLGMLLAKGTVLSVIMVLVFLPALMSLLDKAIQKTTLRTDFCNKTKGDVKHEEAL